MPEKILTKFTDDVPKAILRASEKSHSQPQVNGGKKRPYPDSSLSKLSSMSRQSSDKGHAHISIKKQRLEAPNAGAREKGAVTQVRAGFGTAATPNRIIGNKTQAGNPRGHPQPRAKQPIQYQRSTPQSLLKIKKELAKARANLPIAKYLADIRMALKKHDILLLNGETGSGKSTQTPQFLCNEPWCKRKQVKITNKGNEEIVSVGGMIAITQPRRVAAITLAQRVACEMGCSPESKEGLVGYSVRFDTKIPAGTKIKFVTEGMLLQEMIKDPGLRKYSAIFVDEIHERSVDVDLLAGFLRTIVHGDKKLRGGIPLKLVVMSATLDMGGLQAFLGKPEARLDYQPGNDHGRVIAPHLLRYDNDSDIDDTIDTKSYSSWSGFSSPSSSTSASISQSENTNSRLIQSLNKVEGKPTSFSEKKTLQTTPTKTAKTPKLQGIHDDVQDGEAAANGVAVLYVEGRQYKVDVIYEPAAVLDYVDKMLRTICRIHVTEALTARASDILCFLTGQDEIETLKGQLEHWAAKIDKSLPRMKIVPLYGSLSPVAQQEAFEPVKEKFTRKIVLATNIAETSVTVPGVRYVVDCGKAKVKQFRPSLGMESLLIKPISKTSAIQRQGRAGREMEGKCYRIYTEADFVAMVDDEKPEIMRSDVVEAVLKMKARGVDDILAFPLMDRPELVAMEKALLQLHLMGAIDDRGKLTAKGKTMASFPLPAAYGRVIVEATKNDCLLEAIDVIACITTDSELFQQARSEDQQLQIDENRKLLQHHKGDILTYLNTMRKFTQETLSRKTWCEKMLINPRAMKTAYDIRRQLRQACVREKLLVEEPPKDPQEYEELTPMQEDILLKTFVRAFVSKTAILGGNGAYTTLVGRNTINIHPSSVLRGKKVEAILFLEHVFTSKNYAKKVSVIQADWIEKATGGM